MTIINLVNGSQSASVRLIVACQAEGLAYNNNFKLKLSKPDQEKNNKDLVTVYLFWEYLPSESS